jgi:hypothetical protein
MLRALEIARLSIGLNPPVMQGTSKNVWDLYTDFFVHNKSAQVFNKNFYQAQRFSREQESRYGG